MSIDEGAVQDATVALFIPDDGGFMLPKFFTPLFILLFSASTVWGKNLLQIAEQSYFQAETAPRIGLEIELTGLNPNDIIEILRQHLGGEVSERQRVEKAMEPGNSEVKEYLIRELLLVNSSMGTVVVKPEDNSTSNSKVEDNYAKTRIFEIVTPPIVVEQVSPLQEALEEMRRLGALGTSDGFAVAIQVNVEMGEGNAERIKAIDILQVLRNYLSPDNRKSIASELKAASYRQPYLGLFSPEMMSKILNPNYKPSNQQFFMDFMYRQSLEILGVKDAWLFSDEESRARLFTELEGKNFDVLLPVMKYNHIRVSAVLMFLFPEDPLSRYLDHTGWFHRYPILEFREPNNDFKLLTRVRQFLGLIQFSKSRGELLKTDWAQTKPVTRDSFEHVGRLIPTLLNCQKVFQ